MSHFLEGANPLQKGYFTIEQSISMANPDSHVTIHMVASLDGFIARRDWSVDWLETSDEFVGGEKLDHAVWRERLQALGDEQERRPPDEPGRDEERRVRHAWRPTACGSCHGQPDHGDHRAAAAG